MREGAVRFCPKRVLKGPAIKEGHSSISEEMTMPGVANALWNRHDYCGCPARSELCELGLQPG